MAMMMSRAAADQLFHDLRRLAAAVRESETTVLRALEPPLPVSDDEWAAGFHRAEVAVAEVLRCAEKVQRVTEWPGVPGPPRPAWPGIPEPPPRWGDDWPGAGTKASR